MDSFLNAQRPTIFSHVGVLIYVFDVESRDLPKDIETYRECLEALTRYSPEAAVFLLVHKMDLIRTNRRSVLEKKTRELQEQSGEVPITVFGTSIYDESLYKVGVLSLLYTMRIDRMSCTGMVSYCTYTHPQRCYPHETPNDLCRRL